MQPQRCEARVENDEYKREQQRLAKRIKCMVVLINDHIFAFCVVRKRARILKLFQRNVYALPAFSHFSHFCSSHMHDRPAQKHVQCLLIHTCWFKGYGDACEAYTANTYT